MQVGSGGQRRKALKGKGPTPKATDRPHHPAGRRARADAKRKTPGRSPRTGSGSELLYGRNSVLEALQADIPVTSLAVQQYVESDDRIRAIMLTAAERGLPIMESSRAELDRMTDGGNHQGVALRVPAYDYAEPRDLLTGSAPLIIALDGVTDPRNLGAIVRSAAAFGATGIVVPQRRSVGVTAAAWKTSAGALARVPVARAVNLTRTLTDYQKAGCTVIGLAVNAATTIRDIDPDILTGPVVLVIGSEGKGMGRLVEQTCDWLTIIPIEEATESLNASVAASIALYTVSVARAGSGL